MLNIPSTVKTLFKTDGVRKNFRVHFPNGELSDLTNSDIVQESVKFTESLCSQDVLKFGLTESSVIEFETVGVANMYGMTIECGCEIDLSSLSAAEITAIASGTWDGTYVSTGDSDIGYAYFRVPYGVFRVESCARDHQAMTHRKVKAYTENYKNISMPTIEQWKLATQSCSNTYQPDINRLMLSYIYDNDLSSLIDSGRAVVGSSVSAVQVTQPTNAYTGGNCMHESGNEYPVCYIGYDYYTFYLQGGVQPADDSLYSLSLNGAADMIESVCNAIETLTQSDPIDYEASGYASLKDLLFQKAHYAFPKIYFQGIRNDGWSAPSRRSFGIKSDEFTLFYPYVNNSQRFYIWVPYEVRLWLNNPHNGGSLNPPDVTVTLSGSAPTLDQITETSPVNMPLQIGSTNTINYVSKLYSYTFEDSYDSSDLLNSILELQAAFLAPDRLGGNKIVRLSNTSPVSVSPGEYMRMWWDEYDVLPIGSVMYSYAEKKGSPQVTTYQFGPGLSIYDMTDNDVLSVLKAATPSTIETLLDSSFIPYLDPIAFTPVDLNMKGLPYIEAGDYLAVTAGDGTIARSFNLRQEISGVQVLTSDIESTSGLIIEAGGS